MKILEERILQNAVIKGSDRLEVGDFLNRMLDPAFLYEMAMEFYEIFGQYPITKVLTVESAGIGIATMTAYRLSASALFAQKNRCKQEKDAYIAPVDSKSELSISVPKKYIKRSDHILIVDDFLGTGSATNALVDIVRQAGADLVGVGVAIERKYLGGGDKLRERGIRVASLASILSADTVEGIVFEKENEGLR